MTTNLQDYVELLNAEQHVDVEKLREHARHGISPRVRGEVWLYLLEVLSEDKTSEITTLFDMNTQYQTLSIYLPPASTSRIIKTALAHHTKRFYHPTYAGLISSTTSETPLAHSNIPALHAASGTARDGRQVPSITSPNMLGEPQRPPPPLQLADSDAEIVTLRSQYIRLLPPAPNEPISRQTYMTSIEEVLGKYWNARRDKKGKGKVLPPGQVGEEEDGVQGTDQLGEREWVYLATPFVCCLTRPVAVFLGFQRLMERLETFPPLPSRLASFLTLFRLCLPDLFAYFEDEQVPYIDVALTWCQTLLAKEMWLANLLRLWDAYLASDDMFELHCYVCVALLNTLRETLEELDGIEVKLMLLDLPPIDIDRLLQDAANLRVSQALPRPAELEAD